MRNIVSPLSGIRSPFGGRSDLYKVAGFRPALVADMSKDYFRNVSRQSFNNIFTTSRLGNATMVDSDGLLKWGPHNLLTYSEDFSNAAWTKSAATVTANATTAPDGTLTADKIIATAVSGGHFIYQNNSASFTQGTFSVFAKAAEYTNLRLIEVGSFHYYASFDLTDGTVSATGGANFVSASAAAVGDGWYICTIVTDKTSAGAPSVMAFPDGAEPTTTPAAYTGDGTSGIYIWGAHLYRSDLGGMAPVPVDARVAGSTTYVPTTSTAKYLPRRHNHVYNGTSWVDAGYLHESEARTNLLKDTIDMSTAEWVTQSATLSYSDGWTDVDEGVATGTHSILSAGTNRPVADGTSTYTYAVDIEYVDRQHVVVCFEASGNGLSATIDLVGKTITRSGAEGVGWTFASATIEDLGADVVRVSVSGVPANTGMVTLVYGATSSSSVRSESYTGTGKKWRVRYAQLEAASTPSSYIPTSGSTATRAAETLTIPAANLPWPTPQVIGDELVTNGTFDTDSDWTKGTGWTISGGVASNDGTNDFSLSQDIGLTAGAVYEVTYEVTSFTSGIVSLSLGESRAANRLTANAAGTYTKIMVASASNANVVFYPEATFIGTIDNISVKEINPLAVCIQMEGDMTYADENDYFPYLWRWYEDVSNYLQSAIDHTGTRTGMPRFFQVEGGTVDQVAGLDAYSPGVNVPFNIASRHGSTFINGAVGGTALTEDTTPIALPDLSSTDLQIAYDFMGNVKQVRIWVVDIGDTGIAEASS